jgi:hypothetical protein
VARQAQNLMQELTELARLRHEKYGRTIFHLEPNIKDGPGGLRDYNVANWLALISAMEKLKVWPDANTLLSVADHCLRSKHYITVIVAGKQPAPQWLDMESAVKM